jgi:hypothetical protein
MDAPPRNIDEHSAAEEEAGRRHYRALTAQVFMRR